MVGQVRRYLKSLGGRWAAGRVAGWRGPAATRDAINVKGALSQPGLLILTLPIWPLITYLLTGPRPLRHSRRCPGAATALLAWREEGNIADNIDDRNARNKIVHQEYQLEWNSSWKDQKNIVRYFVSTQSYTEQESVAGSV